MKLKLSYRRPDGNASDLAVTVDNEATVAGLADALQRRDPARPAGWIDNPTLRIEDGPRSATLPTYSAVVEAGVRSGASVTLVPGGAEEPMRQLRGAALVTVFAGPDRGTAYELSVGVNTIGRDPSCDVHLNDSMVSKRHARINVGDVIEVVDDNSSNGVLLGADLVQRAVVRSADRITIGDTVIGITSQHVPVTSEVPAPTTAYNRSPRLDPPFAGNRFVAPEPPQPPQSQRFPLIMSVAPLLIGAALFAATRSLLSILFVAMSPIMFVGTWVENKWASKKAFAEAIDRFRANLADLVVDLQRSADEERGRRRVEHPSTEDVVGAAAGLTPLLWTRRPEHVSFLELRLGLGTQPSRTEVELPTSRNAPPDLRAELLDVVSRFAAVDHVPVVGAFGRCGSIGVSGSEESRLGAARGLVAQLVGLHSPSEVVLVGMASARTAAHWDWLKWLPHSSSDHSPLASPHLASTAPACANVIAELEELIELRGADMRSDRPTPLPVVVVVVEDDAPFERSAAVALAEHGPAQGVHLIWMAARTAQLPAACRTYLELESDLGGPATGKVIEGEQVHPVVVEPLDTATVDRMARRLAPVVDVNAATDDESDLATSVSFLIEAGPELAEGAEGVLDRWKESNSVHPPGQRRRRMKRDSPLRALVGRGVTDPFYLDLRGQGPHALVGGTTGAGKSEFLQTWILGMASAYSPQRVTFLFVDYKGGSAFADCVHLPHAVGLVTDLSPHLVRRALTSLNAELRYREHILNRKKKKDLLELEKDGDPETPPSLVIVVDEFAALVAEVPEFVDGVVNVAQRGRSLGLHLILATQRPAGVIKENLRANTNLRVALRMADEDDSMDVVGTQHAASFDPALPGRAIAKTGPGRLTVFQAGYVGGWTSSEPPPPKVDVATLSFGGAVPWEDADVGEDDALLDEDPGPTDIQRIVAATRLASDAAGLESPRKPWLPELAGQYDLAELPSARRDRELTYGVLDDPEKQEQPVVAFHPDVDGNMAVYGTGGAGKSTFLRSIAVAAGLTKRGGPCFVYGLDFGARGLQMLEVLPHVGAIIGGEDEERAHRLLRQLRATLDERAGRYAAVSAGSIDEYRQIADQPDEPRILLLIDGMAAFRTGYEVGEKSRFFDMFQSIASDGRPVGLHVLISADRPAAVPTSLASSIQQRLVLRLTSDMDLATLGVPADGFDAGPPPGRGFIGANEVQVGVFGGDTNVAEQAAALNRLAASMQRAGSKQAPAIERLAEDVALGTLPVEVDGLPVLGIGAETLGPVGFEPRGVLLVVGPARSGKTSAVTSMVRSLGRLREEATFAYLGNKRSPLATAIDWDHGAAGPDAVMTLATELTALVNADDPSVRGLVVVIDGVGDFVNSSADFALQELIKACRGADRFVIASSETSEVTGSWPLLQAVKSARHGLALQPDQMDGDNVFGTSFPKLRRADFPVSRGMYVRAGRVAQVQVAR